MIIKVFIIFFLLLFSIVFFILLYEKYREYLEKDFELEYFSDTDSYYFWLQASPLQFKKLQIAKKIYAQGTIIKRRDNSTHIVTRLDEIPVNGRLRIFAQPYLPQLEQPYIKLIIQNYGAINFSVISQQTILDIKEEILNHYTNESDSIEAIETLEKISKEEPVNQTALKKLLAFINRHEVLISLASNLISLVSGILGLIV